LIVLVCFFLGYPLGDKIEIEIAKRVAFDCDGLDVGWYITRLGKLVDHTLNADTVFVEQLPTRLLEGERRIFLHLLEAWRVGSHLAFQVAKEQFVALVDPLNNVLNRLRANQIPVLVLRQFLELGDMGHQRIRVQSFARQLVVSAMQRYAVVVDQARNVDLLMQMLILFLAIQLELVGFHTVFCSSIYCRMVAAEM